MFNRKFAIILAGAVASLFQGAGPTSPQRLQATAEAQQAQGAQRHVQQAVRGGQVRGISRYVNSGGRGWRGWSYRRKPWTCVAIEKRKAEKQRNRNKGKR
jgi:hypothetical protein